MFEIVFLALLICFMFLKVGVFGALGTSVIIRSLKTPGTK